MVAKRSHNRRHDVPFLYKYVTPQTGIAVLTSESLRWSAPPLFNDPFDVARSWRGPTVQEIEDACVARFADYVNGEATPESPMAINLMEVARAHAIANPAVFEAEMRFFLHLMRPNIERNLADFQSAWDERLPGMRILCFSADPSSAAMWAHYAKGHEGMVLQFESSDERDSSWLLAEPVIYQDKAPELPPASHWVRGFLSEIEIEWDDILREYQFVKHTDWSYEREYRIVSGKKVTESDLYFDYLFHPEDLRGVILGMNVAPNDESTVRQLVSAKYPNATIYRARVDQESRSISYAPAP